jgi:hypothetical protein
MIGGPENAPDSGRGHAAASDAHLIRTFSGGTLHAREVPNRRKTAEEEKASIRIGQIVSCSKLASTLPASRRIANCIPKSSPIPLESHLCSDLPLV